VILIEPGRVDTQLRRDDIAAPRLDPDDVADAVLFAVGQPRAVAINEIVMRPVHQEV
jgi:NADP-dependent 3-hydroxy acid dehydrogenase YdfG